jgi:hypothetical protein
MWTRSGSNQSGLESNLKMTSAEDLVGVQFSFILSYRYGNFDLS